MGQSVPPQLVSAGEVVNGIFTGAVEVFPYESNARMCRDNVTQGADAVTRLISGVTANTYDLST